MESKTAAILFTSLMERIERDQAIGFVSSHEFEALKIALAALHEIAEYDLSFGKDSAPSDFSKTQHAPREAPPNHGGIEGKSSSAILPAPLSLCLRAIEREEVSNGNVLLCLDFGTAMSKAFATVLPNRYLDLELGKEGGEQGYTLPSSIFIADDAKAYFGFDAIEMSQDLVQSGRERLDSIKGWLSLRSHGNLDGENCLLSKAMNPTAVPLTQGDLIRFYLAYLTDIAEHSLARQGVTDPRYSKRRFARPCWPDATQEKWAEELMRTMLAEAQILADTFTGQWERGIPVSEIKAAVQKIRALERRPDYLIDFGVPEPVAVAAGVIAESENLRDAFMVVDVGAGTTDFGLFIATHKAGEEKVRVFQVSTSIHGLMQAGDKVDSLLRGYISKKEGIDASDNSGRMILADLSRRIRSSKETLFKTGRLEYVLADGTVGEIQLQDFLAEDTVVRFAQAVEKGFKASLDSVDESWLRMLAGSDLNVVLTGGSSPLPMMQALGKGPIEIRGFRIMRRGIDPRPDWMKEVSDELLAVYPQLAVAIGGAAESMPETLSAPPTFAGGGPRRHSYIAGNLHVSGS